MNSQTGRRPAMAAPTAIPAKPISVIGVSIIRLSPYFFHSPRDIWKGKIAKLITETTYVNWVWFATCVCYWFVRYRVQNLSVTSAVRICNQRFENWNPFPITVYFPAILTFTANSCQSASTNCHLGQCLRNRHTSGKVKSILPYRHHRTVLPPRQAGKRDRLGLIHRLKRY